MSRKNHRVFRNNSNIKKKGGRNKFSSTPKIPKLSSYEYGDGSGRNGGKKVPGRANNGTAKPNLPSIRPGLLKSGMALQLNKKLNLNSARDRELLIQKYKYLLRSPNTPKEKVVNFLTLVVRGLHYSTNCLKACDNRNGHWTNATIHMKNTSPT